MDWDDDRLIELVGRFSTLLSRAVYALETIASAQTAMAQIEIANYKGLDRNSFAHNVIFKSAQCQEPCCQREA